MSSTGAFVMAATFRIRKLVIAPSQESDAVHPDLSTALVRISVSIPPSIQLPMLMPTIRPSERYRRCRALLTLVSVIAEQTFLIILYFIYGY